ncbi:helix-turn-helix domain-containing protein [uncultured Microscilla sp.]|uniref:helix-turn-helix domain-containing protein n=1 Tax=uncultured Microscilla sp. TaxID=432653 RepID=UPI002611B24B|nr:helix-turn-helix domain-containing protein [uncultured Microscilla sp.]
MHTVFQVVCVWWLVFATALPIQVFAQADSAIQVQQPTYYYCPPCGCNADHVVYNQPGVCPEPGCKMKLLPSKNAQVGRIAFVWTQVSAKRWAFAFYKNLTLPSIIQGLILAFILLFNFRNNRQANVFLAILLFAISFHSFRYYVARRIFSLLLSELLNQPDYHFGNLFIPFSFIFIIGPALYFYVKSLTLPQFRFKRKDLVHFIPATITLMVYLVLWLQSLPKSNHHSYSQAYLLFNSVEQVGGILSGLIYNLLAFRLLKKHRRILPQQFSNTNAITLNWLQVMIVLLTLVWLAWLVIALFNIQVFSFVLDYIAFYPLQIFLAIIIYIIGFAGFIQPQVYTPNMVASLDVAHQASSLENTANTEKQASLSQKSPHIDKVIQAMEKEQLYLHPTLTLNELARHLHLSPKVLSQILNNELNKNFHDFVNYYRVEEVKQRLLNPQHLHLTILGIAFDAGFNSKSTFNRIFMKFTQMSPKQYRNQHL